MSVEWDLARRASMPSGGWSTCQTVDGDLINRYEVFDEADLDAALARFDELSRPAPRLENAASRVLERYLAYFAARDWAAMAESLADDFLGRRSSSRGERRHPTRSGCRDRERASHRRHRVHRHDVDRHCDPRGAPRPRSSLVSRVADWPERVPQRNARRCRDRRRQPDRGPRRVRPRRHRRRLRGTRRPVPRRRSRRARAHVVGHRAGLSPRSTGTSSPRRHRTG